MTGLSTAGANTCLAALVAAYPYLKLHIGDPGAAMTANPATETTRKLAAWNAPAGANVDTSNAATWAGYPASEDVTHITGWSALVAGAAGWSGTVTANPITAGDTFELTAGQVDVSFPVAS